MPNLIFEYARLFRLPGLGGLSMAPIFGAISLMEVGVHVGLIAFFALFMFGILKSIYGFVLNDYADLELDRLSDDINNRPLVKGTISKRVSIGICYFCIIGAFVILFLFFFKNHPTFYLGILCLVLALIFGTIYNLYGKRFMSSAFIASAADALIVLVAAFVVSPNGSLSVLTWVISILLFLQFLFMTTVVGGIKDADHDYMMNVKNIALVAGVKVNKEKNVFMPFSFKTYGFGIRLLSAFFVFVPYIFFGIQFEIWQILLLTFLVLLLLVLTIKILTIKTFKPTDPKILQLFGLQGILRYSLVPFMLIPIIGLFNGLILIIFPIVWFIVFIPLSGKKISQPVA